MMRIKNLIRFILTVKKRLCSMICLGSIVSIMLCSCGNQGNPAELPDSASNEAFQATVTEVENDSILVKPVEGSPELKSSDKFSIPYEDEITLQTGDVIEIEYGGDIMETYPAQLGEVYSLKVIKEAENGTDCTVAADGNDALMTLCELPKSGEEEIGNQIPQWVSDADRALPMYVMTSTDLEDFNDYAKKIFPSFYDDGWTKEQSGQVYLGQGIEMHHLDDSVRVLRAVHYPVILNGVVVSVLDVFEDLSTHEMSWQAGPQLANQLNALIQEMASYDTETALLLGYNRNNVIGIIGSFNGSDIGTVWKNYYILDIDHVENKEVDTKLIPMQEVTKGIVVDAMEPLCTERTAS